MKRQIKKLNTFNKKLQKLASQIKRETIYLTYVKNYELAKIIDNGSELDKIDLLWDNLNTLCEDMIRYSVCNPL